MLYAIKATTYGESRWIGFADMQEEKLLQAKWFTLDQVVKLSNSLLVLHKAKAIEIVSTATIEEKSKKVADLIWERWSLLSELNSPCHPEDEESFQHELGNVEKAIKENWPKDL